MESYFSEDKSHYNEEGRALAWYFEDINRHIVDGVVDEDMNIVEAENILLSSLSTMFAEIRLCRSSDAVKARRKKEKEECTNGN
jgi:hypothetical protein